MPRPLISRTLGALAVGGIYTVIKTKTAQTVKELRENYALLGPYEDATAKLQVRAECSSEAHACTRARTRARTSAFLFCGGARRCALVWRSLGTS